VCEIAKSALMPSNLVKVMFSRSVSKQAVLDSTSPPLTTRSTWIPGGIQPPLDRASDRTHRIGQKRPVTIYRLVAQHTIEEKIVDLHKHKRDLADSLLEGSDMSGKVSTTELLRLINE
jgi:hypothetical protein